MRAKTSKTRPLRHSICWFRKAMASIALIASLTWPLLVQLRAETAEHWQSIPVRTEAESLAIFEDLLQVSESGEITFFAAEGESPLFYASMKKLSGPPDNEQNIYLFLIPPLSDFIAPGSVLETQSLEKHRVIPIRSIPSSNSPDGDFSMFPFTSGEWAQAFEDPRGLYRLITSDSPVFFRGRYQDTGQEFEFEINKEELQALSKLLEYWAAIETGVIDPPMYFSDPRFGGSGAQPSPAQAAGDSADVIKIDLLQGVTIFSSTFCSRRNGMDMNFMASLKDAAGNSLGSVANEIGCGDCKRLIQIPSDGIYYLTIDTAHGPWQIDWEHQTE